MGKLLKPGEKLTKQNFVEIFDRYRAEVKAPIQKEGKTEYQIAQEKVKKEAAAKEYNALLVDTFALLSKEKKQELYSKLDQATRQTSESRAKGNIRAELEDNGKYPPAVIFDKVKEQLNAAKSYDKSVDILRPFLSKEELAQLENYPHPARPMMMLDNIGADNFKYKFLGAIGRAETGDKARELAAPFMQDQLKDRKYNEYEINAFRIDEVKDDFFRIVAESLDEKQIEKIQADAEKYTDITEKDWEEVGKHPLAEKTNAMIEKINADKTLSPEEKEQAVRMINKIDKDTITTETTHINALNDNRKEIEEALSRDARKTGDALLGEQGIDPHPLNPDETLREGKAEDYNKLKSMEMQFSEDTKNKMKEVFEKLEAYGYAPQGVQQEEGEKQYALSAYGDTMKLYQDALEKQDVKKSVELAKELDKHNKQIHDLVDTVNQFFPSNEGDMYPGNVDVLRNDAMPQDLRKDVKGVSKLNALYAIYGFIKEADVTVDEFLERPMEHIREPYSEALTNNQPMEAIKGEAGADAIYNLTRKDPNLNKQLSAFGMPRIAEGLATLETDPQMKANNYATSFAFTDTIHFPYQHIITDKNALDAANKETLDRFLLVEDPQVDDRLLSGSYFDPEAGKKVQTKGFDEVEYLANTKEDPSEFYARLKQNVVDYMALGDMRPEGEEGLSNTDMVRLAQKAAAKFLIVNGPVASKYQNQEEREYEEEAIRDLTAFIKNGKREVGKWIDEAYLHPTNPNRPVLEEKAERLMNSFDCNNPYANTVKDFIDQYNEVKNQEGNNEPYAQEERGKKTIEEKKAFLTQCFRDGDVPQSFYQARMKQLEKGDVNAELPPFFETDALREKADYIKDTYGEEALGELSAADQDRLYDQYISRAKEEKRIFLAKNYMAENKLVQQGQFFTMDEMEKLHPTANIEAHEAEKERIAEEEAAKLAKKEHEKQLPHEVRIKLVRDGERLNKHTFPEQMSRFIESVPNDVEKKEGETELQMTHRKEVLQEDRLRRSAFVGKINSMLTPAQKEKLARYAPIKGQKGMNRIIFRRMADMIKESSRYYEKSSEEMSIGNGPRKTQLAEELKQINDTVGRLDPSKVSLEEAKQICSAYLTPEQLNDPRFSPANVMNATFFIENHEYCGKELANMLTQEQLNELNQTVENYVAPWNRTHEEMGVKVFTAQTEQAKAQIDQMTTLNGQPLTFEQKEAMKADLDAANDFLRDPKGEDPESAYFSLNTDYEHAVLHDGQKNGATKMAEEGLDKDAVEQVANPDTGTLDNVVAKGKEAEQKKWEEQEFKYSPETKKAIKHVFSKMKEYGYGGQGIIGEADIKEYGLSKIARKIDAYRAATRSGDPIKMANASKEMMEEKARLDEMLGYVKENFPTDRHLDNFAKAGNIDVVRNGNFPPEYRYDDATITHFNSLFIVMNFAEANGIDPDEFLEHPAKYMGEYYLDKGNKSLNNVLKDKTGGEALFEIAKRQDFIPRAGYGSARAMEAYYFLDKDPEIRAHNHGLGDYIEKLTVQAADADINRRAAGRKQGHVDRLLFVSEPTNPATILGIPLYNSKTLSYDQPGEFNELDYLQNNGKSVGEMKELLDKNIKEYLIREATERTVHGDKLTAIDDNGFLEIAQKAASKILMAKHMEKDDPAYEQLKGLLTNGQQYVNDLLAVEKNKVAQEEKLLENAKIGLADVNKMIEDKRAAAEKAGQRIDENDPEMQMLAEIKEQRTREIAEHQAYLDANGAYKKISPNMQEKSNERKYVSTLETLERAINDYGSQKRPAGVDLKPDDDFNRSIVNAQKELASIDSRIDARLNEIVNSGAVGTINKDDQIQILGKMKEDKIAEIAERKAEYIEKLDRDVQAGRIPASYRDVRVKQVNDPNYKFNDLPALFPKPDVMNKNQYIDFLKNDKRQDLTGYDDADKDALYEVYVAEQNAKRNKEIEEFAIKKNAEALGFASNKPEAPAAEPVPEAQAEREEVQNDYSGKWFEPGTEVDHQMLIDKVNAIEDRFAQPINDENWLKNREEYEARGYERVRLGVLFEESWKTLPTAGKENVFEALNDETKSAINKEVIDSYVAKLGAKGKSAEVKALGDTIRAGKDTLTLAEVEQMTAGVLTDEEKADPALKPYNHVKFEHISEKNPQAWTPLLHSVPENELQSVALKADAKRALMEKPLDEVKVKKYGAEVDSLKGVLDNMQFYNGQPLNEQTRAEIKGKLDRAQDMLSGLTREYESALGDVRIGREERVYGMNRSREVVADRKLGEEGIEIKSDSFGTRRLAAVEKVNIEGQGTVDVVKPEGAEQLAHLKEKKFEIRPETKQTIKDIFAKFDEYGYDQSIFEPEEGTKVYALHRYNAAAKEFKKNISSNDPVEKLKAIESADKMKVEYDRVKELAKQAGDLFGVEEGGFYPGNLDVEREDLFPPEFRKDLGGISALNGLYVMYRTLKEKNLGVDEFLDDPRKYVHTEAEKVIEKLDINHSIKGKSGVEAMMEICKPSYVIDPISGLALGRTIETVAKMEKDPALRENNIATEYAHTMSDDYALNATAQREDVTRTAAGHLDRYLMVKEPQEDASLSGAVTIDYKTMTLIPAREFDEVEYLVNANEDPKEYADRVLGQGLDFLVKMHEEKDRKDSKVSSDVEREHAVRAMQLAAIKFLGSRPDINKKSEAYKTLSGLAEKGPAFVKEKLNEKVAAGVYDVDVSEIGLDDMKNVAPKKSLEEFKKSEKMKTFGDDVRLADKNANRNLKDLQAALTRAQTARDRANNDVARQQADQQVREAQARLNEAVNQRKTQLMEDFRAGRITEEYLNKRNEQLDNGKFNDKVPKMFEADELLSKNDYLSKKYPNDYRNFSKEEKNELYQRYVDNAKREKDHFIGKKYLEDQKIITKSQPKTKAEREAAENVRLQKIEAVMRKEQPNANARQNNAPQMQQEAPQVQQNEPQAQNEVQNPKPSLEERIRNNNGRVEINLDEEDDPIVEDEKEDEKIIENKAEVKEEEKLEDGVERMNVDLDEEEPEMNNDILNFAEQKALEKDSLKK